MMMTPKTCCNYDGNQEAKAWAWNSGAQGLMIVNQLFLIVALLRLAERDAGCEEVEDSGGCANRVHGMKPSSLLTTITSVTGLLASLVLPPIGALIDRSSFRRGVGMISAMILLIISGTNLIISQETWFIVLVLTVVGTLVYFIHLTVMYSYVPELTENIQRLTSYNGTYVAIRTAVMVPILPLVIGIAFLFNGNPPKFEMGSLEFDVMVAKISQIICLVLTSICFTMTFWRGLKSRPPKAQAIIDEKKIKIHETGLAIWKENRPLFWYLIALIPLSNTTMAFASIAVTFVTSFLGMDSVQIALTILLFSFFGVVGSKVHPLIAKRINLMNDLKLNVLCWIILLVATGLVVNSSERKTLFFFATVIWGFTFGWAVPSMRTVYITLIPSGQEAEYMGIYLLFSGGFVWFPPLLFTILNEVGVAMNIIMIIFSSLFVVTLFFLFMVGDYGKAVENAKALIKDEDHCEKSAVSVERINDASQSNEENDIERNISRNEQSTSNE